ncbi:uncharacterized protein C6orf106 homolog [Varroa jacobsoni]|uniref:uncharacterized protein C6orf106 homolog n=1 Tax=Varroa jacobsoni TaxID=62625 RepID=UPI000BF58553|nr:uncharacterized protein C6orf106 homolog [Varroa jacobsoni]
MEVDDTTTTTGSEEQQQPQQMDPDWGGLLQEFSRMGTTDRDVLIQRMQQLAEGLSQTESAFFLDMNNWNLEAAVWSYFEFSQNFSGKNPSGGNAIAATSTNSSNANTEYSSSCSSSSNNVVKTDSCAGWEQISNRNSSSSSSGTGSAQAYFDSFTGPVNRANSEEALAAAVSQWAIQPARAMSLVEDRTIGNGEAVTPDTAFVKTLRVRNSGPQAWPRGSVFKYVSGDFLKGDDAVRLDQSVAPNEEIDLSIRLLSPAEPGRYQSQWRLYDDDGPFGDTIWIAFQVQEGGVLAVTQQMDACHA